MRGPWKRSLLVLAAAWLVTTMPTAWAADQSDQAAYDAAFEQMRRDPGNSDKALAYAKAAIAVGDFEGAISALERLLIFNPDLPRIRLEIGVLYYRLGSYDLARTYLGGTVDRPDIPEDARAQARDYLGQIDRQTSQHRISGQVLSGLRYQSNANAGPDGGQSRLFGFDLLLTNNLQKKHDFNFFGIGVLNYVYDFQNGDPLTMEANLTSYGAKQFRQSQFDLSLMQVDIGPRIGLPGMLEGSSIRPYVVGDYLSLGGTSYLNSYGGGINYLAPLLDRLLLEANFEIQNRQYWQDAARPRIENRNGDFIAVRLTPRYALTDNQIIGLVGEFDRTMAVQGYERNSQFLLGPLYQIKFEPPVDFLSRPWTASGYFNRVWRNYANVDPLVDPFNTRRDTEWNVGAVLDIGIVDRLNLVMQLSHSWIESTIPNYSYKNLIGAMALSFTF
ncbi:MAG: hypothetical protein JO021_05890 [Alphaproteobacteria bacterium]|nr:hypothetical protein [Alphaproteobacteria bacterium]